MGRYAKTIVAAVGACAVALLEVFGPDTQTGQVLTIVAAVASTLLVYLVPNAPAVRPAASADEARMRRHGQ